MLTIEPITMPLPKCGLWPNVDNETYHAWDCMSNGRLTTLLRGSALHVREEIDHPEENTTAAKMMGSAMHVMAIQPDLFDSKFIVPDVCSARKKDGVPCDNPGKFCVGGEWFCGTHIKKDRHEKVFAATCEKLKGEGFVLTTVSAHNSHYYDHDDGRMYRVADHPANVGSRRRMLREGRKEIRVDLPPYGHDDPRTILPQTDLDKCLLMREQIERHEHASSLLKQRGECELSGVFHDRDTGALSKIRLDKRCDRLGAILDIKTTIDSANPESFARTLFAMGYHRQAAFYLDGMDSLSCSSEDFAFVVVEKDRPFAVAVYRLTDDAISLARRELLPLKRRYAECVESGHWPGFEGIGDIGIPEWAAKKLERIS